MRHEKMAHGYADIAMRRYRAGPLNILIFKKLTGLWWAGEVVNHIWIYGSKVAKGISAFQRLSCSLCSHHCVVKFSGVITKDRSDVHAKGQGQRSKVKVKVTEVKTQLSHFRTLTPVWIHIWQQSDAQSLMWCRKGVLFYFSRSFVKFQGHTWQKNCRFWPKFGVSGLWPQFELTDGHEMTLQAWSSIEEVPNCFRRSSVKFQGHTGQKKSLILTRIWRFRNETLAWIVQWLWNDLQGLK